MVTKLATSPDKTALTLQMIIDDEAQTVKTGYLIFEGLPDYRIDKAAIKKIQAATDTPEKTRAFFKILSLIGG